MALHSPPKIPKWWYRYFKTRQVPMVSGRFVAYYRVSTDRQGRSGLGLEAQRKAVADYLNGGGSQLVAEFTEVESGKRSNRPQLAAAIEACRRSKATLVIAKLDRLARNVYFISGLLEGKVPFLCCDMPEADRAFLQIAAVFAEWEARKISERTKGALQAAKARGKILGNPRLEEARPGALVAVSKQADKFAEDLRPYINDLHRNGITSFAGIARALNARGKPTARGRHWHPATARLLLQRLGRTRAVPSPSPG